MRGPACGVCCCAIAMAMALSGCGGGSANPPPQQPVATLSPSTINFGNNNVGTSSQAQTLTLTNTAGLSLAITSIKASGPFSQSNNCPNSLTSNASCTVSVTFTPMMPGAASGSVTISDDASNSPQMASLSGNGISPSASVSAASLTFGSTVIGTTTAAQAVTLSNGPGPSLSITSITATGPFSQTNNCPTSLNTNASCAINVTFTPTTAGAASGSISVADNASNSPQVVSLSGTGTAPPVTLSPASLNFPNTVVGTNSAVQILTLTNTLGASITITSITAVGPFSQTNNCSASLGSNAFCLIYVTFSPVSLGPASGSINVVDSASNSPQTTSLSGAGTSGFSGGGNMSVALAYHTATVLNNGEVLVAGSGSGAIFNLTTGNFAAPISMVAVRQYHAATLLNNGKVLITGGYNFTTSSWLASAELYDPGTGTFTATAGNMTTPRAYHTATLLNSGEVLIAGGYDFASLSSAELYDPSTETFTPTRSMIVARRAQTATQLNDGTVLVAGGHDTNNVPLNSAEIYDPVAATFSTTIGSMNPGFDAQRATLLNSGKVLITGAPGTTFLANAQVYDPASKTFAASAGSMSNGRTVHTATLLNDGAVLVAGGLDSASPTILASAELYDPAAAMFTPAGSMLTGRYAHTATLLINGKVLVAGGLSPFCNCTGTTGFELYLPDSLTPAGLVSISVTPVGPTLTLGATQQFIATGTFSDNSTQVLQSVVWSSSNQAAVAISNDASNHGTALALAVGTSTISATAGSIHGSTQLTVQ
jgi:hypothetical protein